MKRKNNEMEDIFKSSGIGYPKKIRKPKEEHPTDFPSWVNGAFGVRCIPEFKFHRTRKWRFDYALPEYRIAVEVEGGVCTNGRHVRPQGFLGDMEKYNVAAVMGWIVIRTTPQELYTDKVRQLIRTAINLRRRPAA